MNKISLLLIVCGILVSCGSVNKKEVVIKEEIITGKVPVREEIAPDEELEGLVISDVSILSKENESSYKDLYGKNFILVSPLKKYKITLSIDNDGKLVGSTGVNRYFASVKFPNDKMSVYNMGSTKAMGPKDEMNAEREYLEKLSEVGSFDYKSGKLTLKTSSGAKLIFNEQKNMKK